MYLRTQRVRRGDKAYEYHQLCRTVRRGGKPTAEVVCHLGRLEPDEARRLSRAFGRVAGDGVEAPELVLGPWLHCGGPLLVERLLQTAELDELFAGWRHARHRQDIARTLRVLLTAQLLEPGSDLNTARFQARLAGEAIPYHHFLRALDVVAAHADALQQGLLGRVQHLFNQELDLVFYDLTSSYFEGAGPAGLAARGYSRDGRGDCPQCVLGLVVTRDGFPVAWEVHRGNTVDAKTLPGLVSRLRERFRIGRCVVVADSGLMSGTNLMALGEAGLPYVLGMRAKTSRVGQALLAATRGSEPEGELDNGVQYWPVPGEEGVRYVVLWSQGRESKTRRILSRKQREAGPKLEQLRRDVAAGKVKTVSTMERRASRIVTEAKVGKFVGWEASETEFRWSWREELVAEAEADAGKYVLQTNVAELTAGEIAETYHQLATVEEAFRLLKSTLRLRPLFHRRPERVKGHIGVCVVALFLLNVLRQALARARVEASLTQAVRACAEVHAAPVVVGERVLWPQPHVGELAGKVLGALGERDLKATLTGWLGALG